MFGVIKNKYRIFEFSRCNIFNLWICVRYYISLWGAESCDIIPIQKFTKENRETRDKVVLLTLEIIKTQLLLPNNNWTMKCMVCPKCVRNGHAWKQPPWVTLNLFLMDTREFLFNLNFSALCSPCFPLRTSVSLCQTFTHVAKLRKRRRHSNSLEEWGKRSTLCSPISTKSRQSTNQHLNGWFLLPLINTTSALKLPKYYYILYAFSKAKRRNYSQWFPYPTFIGCRTFETE